MADAAIIAAIVATVLTAATPLLFAALGELVTERAGVLNLGVEGMMAVGAVSGFIAANLSGSTAAGVASAALAGLLLAVPFTALVVNLGANQVASGLALTFLGLGVSAMAGEGFVGRPGTKLPQLETGPLADLPFFGPALFRQDALVYLALILAVVVSLVLFRTRVGLLLRSAGEEQMSAHSLGVPVRRIRWAATLFGGACAGLGGGYLSLAYTPLWAEEMTAGRGWIALALVVFASWRPSLVVLGAYLFGAITILGFHAQSRGVPVPSQFISALPYLATVLVLVLISTRRTAAPGSLGKPFVPPR